MLTVEAFETIRNFVLHAGDRMTYCARYNGNPHFAFAGFDTFLDPDPDHFNINCDPARSDFPVIVIRRDTPTNTTQYIQVTRTSACPPALHFANEDREALEHHFAIMLRHISDHAKAR